MPRGKRVKKSNNAGLTIGISLVALAALIIAVIGVYEVFFKNLPSKPEENDGPTDVIYEVKPEDNEETPEDNDNELNDGEPQDEDTPEEENNNEEVEDNE